MSDRQYPFIRADARVSRFAALAPIAAALEQWGTGVWHDIGEIGFAAIWVALAAIVLVEVVVAFRRRKYRDRALLWLALVTLANPWADPLIQTLLAARVVRAIRLRRELAEAVGREVFSGRGLRFVTAVSAIGLFGLGWLFSAVETTQHLTVGDGVWFALVTAATVGYGDIVPTTSGGRFIAAALMILGLFVVGLLTGAVAERFTRNKPGGEDVARRLDELATSLERIESNLGGTGGRD
jgi:voltage-gated potassium channel